MNSQNNSNQTDSKPLRILIFSFGFKHGVPVDANVLFDVRFLPNPYWEENLRPKSGLQEEVSGYVVGSDQGREFLRLLEPLLVSVAAGMAENRKELRIGIGCTGGRHRSVAVVEALATLLGSESRFQVQSFHRDIDKSGD